VVGGSRGGLREMREESPPFLEVPVLLIIWGCTTKTKEDRKGPAGGAGMEGWGEWGGVKITGQECPSPVGGNKLPEKKDREREHAAKGGRERSERKEPPAQVSWNSGCLEKTRKEFSWCLHMARKFTSVGIST